MRDAITRGFLSAVSALVLFWGAARANTEDDIRKHIDLLRGIEPTKDQAKLKQLNSRMDEAWRVIEQNKSDALPVLRKELQAAIDAKTSDQFVLLDVAYLLVRQDAQKSAALGVTALERIDPKADVIRANWEELSISSCGSGVQDRRQSDIWRRSIGFICPARRS